jgi:deoxyribonuclease V
LPVRVTTGCPDGTETVEAASDVAVQSGTMTAWPAEPGDLVQQQLVVAAAPAPRYRPAWPLLVAGCFVCFEREHTGRGAAGEPAWAAAALLAGRRRKDGCVRSGVTRGPYEPGLLALREGPLLEAAVRGLRERPDVLLVNATGRDHPRRAGLAVHLGAVLGLPTVGVTHRPLHSAGEWPPDRAGAATPLLLDGAVTACWLRTRPGTRPLVVHAGWRVDTDTAVEIVRHCLHRHRTPAPLREARRLARTARATAS